MENVLYIKKGNLTITEKKKLEKTGKIVIEVKELLDIKSSSYYETDLIVTQNCCNCGCKMYMTKDRQEALKRGGIIFYCTFGHGQSYPKPKS